ncbi:RNA methyltransferase [Christensenellaceae bacterium OttesenSCG-928-L17]|nr:RNA methyltransferase [Christensenellaceae bacterium OttesenSCG-928-L17]
MRIESRKNPIVAGVRQLHAKKGRRQTGLHLIEGEKLLAEAVAAGMRVESVFVEDGVVVPEELLAAAQRSAFTVPRPVMEALCDCVTPQGVCATVQTNEAALPETFPPGMIVALDALQDPGNVGMILRTADAMGAAGVILGEGSADPYAPKTLRAAMGSTYHLPLWQGNLYEALQRLNKQAYCCICGHLQGEEQLPPIKDRCVIVIGNEGNGVDEDIAALCVRVRVPMYGRAESLNASMAAGLLMHEVSKIIHTKG